MKRERERERETLEGCTNIAKKREREKQKTEIELTTSSLPLFLLLFLYSFLPRHENGERKKRNGTFNQTINMGQLVHASLFSGFGAAEYAQAATVRLLPRHWPSGLGQAPAPSQIRSGQAESGPTF